MKIESTRLAKKLSYYINLNKDQNALLTELHISEMRIAGRSDLFRSGDEAKDLYLVKQGWLFSHIDMPDGRRQITKIHLPGDIIGFPDIAMQHMTATLYAPEDVCLCNFSRSSIDTMMNNSPRLSALILSIGLCEQVAFNDLLRVLGRMNAQERIAYMLLDLISRLRISKPNTIDTFRLPLTQGEIGDYLGLTNVYVSQSLIRMEKDGLISRTAKSIQIRKESKLVKMCDFHNRYADLDTSWFPKR